MKKRNAKSSGKKTLKTAFLLFLVVLVVAVSGCISSLGLGPQQQTVEAPNDVMSFSDNTVIPNPPILTGDTFTTSFAMKNLDTFEDANNVKLELYDWGVCTPSTCSSPSGWDAIDSTKLQTSYSASLNSISPNDVQQVECQFRSPSSEKIGGLQASCPIRYKLTYDFSGITTTELNVISNQKFQDMQRAGQTPSTTSTQSKSRGPIKVDFSFGVNQPARTSSTDNTVKIPMYITVENKGSGNVVVDDVTNPLLIKITVPSDLIPNKDCESFKCDDWLVGVNYGSEIGGTYDPSKCKLILDGSKSITKDMFVKGKTQSFRCELTSPDEDAYLKQTGKYFEQKVYSIQSDISYTYQIDNDFSVAIKPMTTG